MIPSEPTRAVRGRPAPLWAAGFGLMLSEESPKPPENPGARHVPSEGDQVEKLVLVVDDEPETREAVVELLEAEGLATLSARDGQEALDLLRSGFRPSLILLDLKMPILDGWEFCRRLAADERLAEIPVAVVTASASIERLPERRTNAGFFTKPVDYERLLKMVQRFCG